MNETILEEPSLYFWLVNGQGVRSIRQLIEQVPELTEEQFQYHVNEEKNDFYNWITDVFHDEEIANLIKQCKTRDDFQEKMYAYLLAEKQQEKVEATFTKAQKELKKDPTKFKEFRQSRNEEHLSDQMGEAAEKITESQQMSVLPKRITRLDAMEERLEELNDFIAEMHKEGRDVTLPRLVLKKFKPKMEFARLSQEEGDFDRVEHVLDEAEKELEDVVMSKVIDVKKDVELLSLSEKKPVAKDAKQAPVAAPSSSSSEGVA